MASSATLKLLVCVLVLGWQSFCCYGHGTFGFDIHHRFSDPVKGLLPVDDLPEKGSLEYYEAMVHRDRILHGRRLSTTDQSHLTFFNGNETFRIISLDFLHYANVSVGTPSLSFLVALDTGSDLFWLPCDCTTGCVHNLFGSSGEKIPLNIYSPNASSTSTTVTCNSTLSATFQSCRYNVSYLSANTSSTGILVEDLLHLTTDDDQLKSVDAPITFGCGKVQTGLFLDGAAPNGLFGLGIGNISVPSILAAKGLASNSFSMCFGPDGIIGRITFGDKGSSVQRETPFNIRPLHPSYNVSVTQIIVGDKTTDINFSAIFDSGISFTYLNDPAYTVITESFNSQVEEKRTQYNLSIPFEYCYDISPNQTTLPPMVNLTMAGGVSFDVTDPLVLFSLEGGQLFYCLGVLKSGNIDIIGQNFMSGYRIVFDREKMVLGWKESNCFDLVDSNTLPINPNITAVRHLLP